MEPVSIRDFNNHSISEIVAIERILDGEKELFELLVRRNNQKLYRVIRSYLKDEVEIEDVMQNSYIKAYTKLYQFKHTSLFSTWLVRIGINEALARVKERSNVYHLSGQSEDFRSKTILEMPDKRQLNPQDRMIRNEAKQLLENAIDSLDPKYRTVYMLKEVEEMSLKDIAEALDLTIANVKVRIHRSKEMLKDKLYEISSDNNLFEFGFSRCDRVTKTVMTAI